MNSLDISVVMPCYNAEGTLVRSLDSIARQTAQPREVVLVDDGSLIPVNSIATAWSKQSGVPVRVLTQPNRGAGAARNVGVSCSEGRYIAFLDSDDIWLPDKLRIQYQIMESGEFEMTAHGYAFEAWKIPTGSTPSEGGEPQVTRVHKWRFAYGNPFFTPTVMVRRDRFSGFDDRFRRVDDYKAWVENFRPGNCGYIKTVLAAGFKPPLGHSGLTASIESMHKSYVAVLNALLDERHIGLMFYLTARAIEGAKLPVRRRVYSNKSR